MKLTDKFGLNKTKSVVFNSAVFCLGLLIGLQFREKSIPLIYHLILLAVVIAAIVYIARANNNTKS